MRLHARLVVLTAADKGKPRPRCLLPAEDGSKREKINKRKQRDEQESGGQL